MKLYRWLVILLVILLFMVERDRVNGWFDDAEGWFSTVGTAGS